MKVKDRVRIKNLFGIDSEINDKYNPVEETGTIIDINAELYPIIVMWDNGIRNSYNESHLEIV